MVSAGRCSGQKTATFGFINFWTSRLMPGKLKDARVIAAGIAVACMLIDDLPEAQYNTFRDPGAAAMLSIVFADAFTLWGRRGWKPLIHLTFWFALVLKFFVQPLFWVQNAWFWDVGTLLLAHGVLGFLAVRGMNLWAGLFCFVATVVCVTLVLCILYLTSLFGSSWIAFYWQLGAARVLVPWVFWTVVLLVEAHCVETKPQNAKP
jgi:hypothetical protein